MSVALASPPEEPDGPTFHFGGIPIRTKVINGDPWLVAVDVCAVLDIRVRDVMPALDADERRRDTIADLDNQDISVDLVSESGLYSLILRSRKPEAKAFKRWITGEVLPSIRKTGRYTANLLQALPTLPEALRGWADAEDARVKAELESAQAWAEATRVRAIADDQHEQIQRDAPKVGFVKHFVEAPKDSCQVGVLAKELGVGPHKLFDYLVSRKRIYKDRNNMYQPYADWVKWFTLRDQHEAPRLHNGQVRTTLYVLPPGKEGIRLMLKGDPGNLYG